MSIETKFDVPFIAALALREKQIQQNYRPIIAVHKWFARRPGTLFRGLVLAELGDRPVADAFFSSNDYPGKRIADPFMGGGTPLLEANRVGCDVQGFDINPMAAWIVREEIEHIDLAAYRVAATQLLNELQVQVGSYYLTDCPRYGTRDVPVKYTLWVKVIDCEACGRDVDLFPGYLLSEDRRHPLNILVCPECGELNEVANLDVPGSCGSCGADLVAQGPAKRKKCTCPSCGHANRYPHSEKGPPRHRPFAIEYYNPDRKSEHQGRFFKKPDTKDLDRIRMAEAAWRALTPAFVPEQEILSGDETDRLHRWGYRRYRELFNERQLLGLELSCRLIRDVGDERIRHALATNLSDLLRYQNMLCRYDTMALKSLDVFSVHGFPVGLVQCESNLLGIANGNGTNVGSGGWTNIIGKYTKAKQYCDNPFEISSGKRKKEQIFIKDEWIGETRPNARPRKVSIHCASSADVSLEPASLDAVLTDPPYFGNVQYGELMDFCYVWLRRLVGQEAEGFDRESTRSALEVTGNATAARDLAYFAQALGGVYRNMAMALKPGAPLAFTFHHNKIEAYYAVGVAILDAGMTCSASLPCPAEMGGSIHISGTSSSIIDTVFVCRSIGSTPRAWLFEDTCRLAGVVADDLAQLREGGVKPTAGDIRCIIYGHLTRMAVWTLRQTWQVDAPIADKLRLFRDAVARFGSLEAALVELEQIPKNVSEQTLPLFSRNKGILDAISF